AGVGVPDECYQPGIGLGACLALLAAAVCDALQLLLDAGDALLELPPVGLDLRFAGPPEEAETTALPLEVCPAPHQAALLVVQVRQLDLQAPFPGCRPFAKDFQDQTGAIDDLSQPRL